MGRRDDIIWATIQRDPKIVERFWSQVQRDESDDGCWQWLGSVRPRGSPSFSIGHRSVAPCRVAWYAATGEAVRFGRVVRMCGNDLCVRPSHLGWSLSRAAERHVIAHDDGYVSISGAVVEYARRPTNSPRTVRCIPARLAQR